MRIVRLVREADVQGTRLPGPFLRAALQLCALGAGGITRAGCVAAGLQRLGRVHTTVPRGRGACRL